VHLLVSELYRYQNARRHDKNLNFLVILSKNTQKLDFMKIRPVGVKLFHVERQTDSQT
jgi:hypothetical protein